MTKLSGLTFIPLPLPSRRDPITARRNKLIVRLRQQRSLADDPNFVIRAQKWIPDENGVKHLEDRQKRVRPWWTTDAAGAVVLSVRYGPRQLEFQKGKSAIAVGTKDKLSAVIDTLIAAVSAGELDAQLEQVGTDAQFKKKRAS